MADLVIVADSPAYGTDAVVVQWLVLVAFVLLGVAVFGGTAAGLFWCGVRLAREPLTAGVVAGLLVVSALTWLIVVLFALSTHLLLACVHPAMLGVGYVWGRVVPPRPATMSPAPPPPSLPSPPPGPPPPPP